MTNDLLDMRFGKGTVQENLARAVAEGRLELLPDGNFMSLQKKGSYSYLQVKSSRQMECRFLNDFLFRCAYDNTAVPYGCRNCYKVKIVPENFKGLIALRGALEDAPYHSKCGVDFFNQNSRDIYAGFLYLDGLEEARAAYREMRTVVDSHPDLSRSVQMTIKRGCSHFEAACGPSDNWTFRDGMAELETHLKARFREASSETADYRQRRMASMLSWLQIAYNLKDDSYLDFTGGKPLHNPTVTYTPE
ncbi:MAG: hypothetical protein WAW41_00690 [Methylobacter sp.]